MGRKENVENTLKPHSVSTILFSGRFDPPGASHIATITRLHHEFKRVIVVVLHNKNRRWPADFAVQIFKEVFYWCKNVEIIKNTTHFAEIEKKELDSYGADYYAAGNIRVLKHIAQLMPVVYVDRAYGLSSSRYKDPVQE